MTKPYEQQPGETTKAYEAFALYRDMGVNRSTDAVSQQLRKSIALIQRWSRLQNWVLRAAAYDEYVDQQARKKLERDAINRRADMLRRHAALGKSLQRFGGQYVLDNKKPDRAQDAISAVKTGIEIERKAEGLPEYLLEVVNADDNELLAQYHSLLAEISGGGSGNEETGIADSPATETPAAPSDDERQPADD